MALPGGPGEARVSEPLLWARALGRAATPARLTARADQSPGRGEETGAEPGTAGGVPSANPLSPPAGGALALPGILFLPRATLCQETLPHRIPHPHPVLGLPCGWLVGAWVPLLPPRPSESSTSLTGGVRDRPWALAVLAPSTRAVGCTVPSCTRSCLRHPGMGPGRGQDVLRGPARPGQACGDPEPEPHRLCWPPAQGGLGSLTGPGWGPLQCPGCSRWIHRPWS